MEPLSSLSIFLSLLFATLSHATPASLHTTFTSSQLDPLTLLLTSLCGAAAILYFLYSIRARPFPPNPVSGKTIPLKDAKPFVGSTFALVEHKSHFFQYVEERCRCGAF
tara:strand:- start:372 stop:698 length:327 start_codon:yes stop_codon:yes gene_type:complete